MCSGGSLLEPEAWNQRHSAPFTYCTPTEVMSWSSANRLSGLPVVQILISSSDLNQDIPRSPTASTSDLCAIFYPLYHSNMPLTDDLVISSSTALAISENLLAILNTIIQSLPEHELRKLRSTIEQSVRLADDLLYNLSVSSTFHMLTMNDGACVQRSFSAQVLTTHEVVPAARNANIYATGGDIFTSGGDVYTSAEPANSRGPTNDIVVNVGFRSLFYVILLIPS